MIDYLKAFALLAAVAVVTGIAVMQIAMRQGGEVVTVPGVAGSPVIAALETLDRSGLYLTVTRLDYSPTVPKDRIIRQKPVAGERLRQGSSVEVVVSRGSRDLVLPDLVGASLTRARATLARSKVKPADIVRVWSDRPEGEALAQKPAPRTVIGREESIGLLVSAGPAPSYVMAPDFVGEPLSTVMSRIKELDLRVSRVSYVPSDGGAKGTVVEQTPPFGTRLASGSFLALTVSEGGGGGAAAGSLEFLYYTVPDGPHGVKVGMYQENADGEKEIYNRVHRPGDTFSLLVALKGRTTVKIFLDDELAEVRRFAGER